MEYVVHLQCRKGCPLEGIQKHGACSRGEVTIFLETEKHTGRKVLVARFKPSKDRQPLEPLYDVTVVQLTASTLMIRGYEWIVGRVGKSHAVAQEWHCEHAEFADLRHAETQWVAALDQVEELKEELARLRAGPGDQAAKRCS